MVCILYSLNLFYLFYPILTILIWILNDRLSVYIYGILLFYFNRLLWIIVNLIIKKPVIKF